jgi:TfoX/Sxy family transcriptional regulator of competence genes
MPTTKTKAKSQKPKRAMPKFTKASEENVRLFESAMKDFPMAKQRKTFGYPSAFVNGNMFAGLHNDKMILRLSPEDAAQMPEAKPFEPIPGRPMKGWVVVPPRILNSARELNAWMEKAFEFTRAMPSKVKRTRTG